MGLTATFWPVGTQVGGCESVLPKLEEMWGFSLCCPKGEKFPQNMPMGLRWGTEVCCPFIV